MRGKKKCSLHQENTETTFSASSKGEGMVRNERASPVLAASRGMGHSKALGPWGGAGQELCWREAGRRWRSTPMPNDGINVLCNSSWRTWNLHHLSLIKSSRANLTNLSTPEKSPTCPNLDMEAFAPGSNDNGIDVFSPIQPHGPSITPPLPTITNAAQR